MEERVFGGRYRVTGTLGHGGMASVYRAVDEQLGREVAVKVFRMGAVDHGERARAEAEIHVLAGLRSPALVTLYDAALDDADGDSYLVMELVPGSDLATRLREGPLDRATTARVGAQVADGLAAVHVQGIVHRDVKPANVLLESDGSHVKLADFGIALLRDAARVTGTGTVMGTAAYIAPEQVLGQPVTGKADVYALGLMLIECLSGRMPFPGTAVESATARLARSPEIDPALPTSWRVLLHVMTATDPAERPSATEAADRLRALSHDDAALATQLLPGGPGTLTPAAAAAGVAGATAVLGSPATASADQATQAMSGADQPTRAMPVTRPQDDATRVMPASGASRQDDVATTVLGAQRGNAGGTGGGAPVAPRAAQPEPPEERKRRTGLIVTLVIVGVLVLAGIIAAVVALGGGGSTPAPTDSSSPSQEQQQPSDEPSQQQPSDEPSQQQPSEPEQQPSEPEQQPSQPEPEPSQPSEPSNGPQPSVQPTLPVQTPVGDTNAGPAGGTGTGTGPGSAPGKSGSAPGHDKG